MLKKLIKLYVKHLLQTLKSSGFIRNFFVRKSGNQMTMFPGTSGNFKYQIQKTTKNLLKASSTIFRILQE